MNKSKINTTSESESEYNVSPNTDSSNAVRQSGNGNTLLDTVGLRNRLTEAQKKRGPKADQPITLQFARSLDAQRALMLLLKHLFPDGEFRFNDMGRYACLQQGLVKQESLLNRLLAGEKNALDVEWQSFLRQNSGDVRFLHGLAVLYREQDMRQWSADGTIDASLSILSAGLWILLLSSADFWNYFVNVYDRPKELELTEEKQRTLLQETAKGIFIPHSHHIGRDYSAGLIERARLHLRCLTLCENGEKGVAQIVKNAGIACQLQIDANRFQIIQNIASELLDDWCVNLIRESEKIVNDAAAIKNLPEGIRKNYDGGIKHLQPYLDLNVPVIRVLRTLLVWYNDWCYDLYAKGDRQEIKVLMQHARSVAKQLIPLCTKLHGHLPENQALSQHFLVRGFTYNDSSLAVKDFSEALAWNEANDNARDLLNTARQDILREPLEEAVAFAEKGQFQEAYQLIDDIEKRGTDKEDVYFYRANICLLHGQDLAREASFRESLDEKHALSRRTPKEEAVHHFQRVLEMLQHIPEESKYHQSASRFQSIAYFSLGIEEMQKPQPNYDTAYQYLEKSLNFCDSEDDRKTIREQMDFVKLMR